MDISAFMTFAERCAPSVDAQPLIEIARTASDFEPLSLTIDGRKPIKILATSKDEAIALAMQTKVGKEEARLGLFGLTFADLDKAGIDVAEAFEPCSALRAAVQILNEDPKHFTRARIAGVQGAARAKLAANNPSDRREERPIHQEDRALPEPAPPPKKPWDVFGSASGKSLLVYEAPASSPR
jgi:type IV secretion system protein VirB1